jgi:hypothetical protein
MYATVYGKWDEKIESRNSAATKKKKEIVPLPLYIIYRGLA